METEDGRGNAADGMYFHGPMDTDQVCLRSVGTSHTNARIKSANAILGTSFILESVHAVEWFSTHAHRCLAAPVKAPPIDLEETSRTRCK